MARIEDSPWAVSVAQVASRAGQSKPLDATFPAPSGIGDEIVGVDEGADVQVVGFFDSIVDGLILSARISAPVHAECTRCLKPIQRNWDVNVTAFFPYEDKTAVKGGKNGAKASEEEVDIVAGEDESEGDCGCCTTASARPASTCPTLNRTTIRKAEYGTYRRFPLGGFRGAGGIPRRSEQTARRDVPRSQRHRR